MPSTRRLESRRYVSLFGRRTPCTLSLAQADRTIVATWCALNDLDASDLFGAAAREKVIRLVADQDAAFQRRFWQIVSETLDEDVQHVVPVEFARDAPRSGQTGVAHIPAGAGEESE